MLQSRHGTRAPLDEEARSDLKPSATAAELGGAKTRVFDPPNGFKIKFHAEPMRRNEFLLIFKLFLTFFHFLKKCFFEN